MEKETIRIVIITRFSVLIERKAHSWKLLRDPLNPRTWFRPANPTMEEKKAYLFAPARLEARLRRFERMLLPSVAAQDHKAEHIVLTSTLLPQPFLGRLETLSQQYGFRLHFADTERRVEHVLIEDSLLSLDGTDRLVTIRVDDDDAIATGLVRRIRRFSHLGFDDYILGFPRGYLLDERTSPMQYAPVTEPNVACGLTRVLRKPGNSLSVYGAGPHNRVHLRRPVVQLPDAGMYLQTTHADNISHRLYLRKLPGGKPLTEETTVKFRKRFGVDLAGI